MNGTFYGIGVGSGDPELLTVKAINAIKIADVIVAPRTEKKDDSVALSIARPYLKENIEILYQTFPMVRDFADWQAAAQENKTEILSLLNAGKNVAFLTLGDPMFFSTYIYVYRLLENEGVSIVTVPGVTAFSAIAAKYGVPVVEGNEILTIIPATAEPSAIKTALKAANNAVVMKVYKNFPQVAKMLQEEDMVDKAVMASRVGLTDETLIKDVWQHRDDKVNYLSTILTRRK